MTLREAIAACLMADSERGKAFIYRLLYGYVMAVVMRYLPQDVDAEEVVNESFVKAFRRLSAFVQQEDDEALAKTFRSWLARIAVNTSIDTIRARKPMMALEEVGEREKQAYAVGISDSLAVQDILALLNELPDIQRSIFNLFEIEGYSHEEIGALLGIPESTSRTYLTRAKQRLRKLYAEKFELTQHIHS